MTSKVHFSSKTDDWSTPMDFFKNIEKRFGTFDLDPCSDHDNAKAALYYTKSEDGLSKEWRGKVWMNPPYGIATGSWLDRFVKHGDGIALVFARTDTRWFHNYALKADALLFTKGRLNPTPQLHDEASYCVQSEPDDGRIDWVASASKIGLVIRAQFDPYPGAFTILGDCKIFSRSWSIFDKPVYGKQVKFLGGLGTVL